MSPNVDELVVASEETPADAATGVVINAVPAQDVLVVNHELLSLVDSPNEWLEIFTASLKN